MASKQYNSPMKMYSDDIIEEIMTQVKQLVSLRLVCFWLSLFLTLLIASLQLLYYFPPGHGYG